VWLLTIGRLTPQRMKGHHPGEPGRAIGAGNADEHRAGTQPHRAAGGLEPLAGRPVRKRVEAALAARAVDGSSGACNQPWYLDRALTRTDNFASRSNGPASMSELRSQLSAGHPVGARIGWAGGGGHFVTISGCLDDATGVLEVRDPIYGTSEISIANFRSSYQGSGSWTHTYYTKA